MKKTFDNETNWLLNHEKKSIETEIERQQREYDEKNAKVALEKKSYQTDILRQVNERDRTQRRDV